MNVLPDNGTRFVSHSRQNHYWLSRIRIEYLGPVPYDKNARQTIQVPAPTITRSCSSGDLRVGDRKLHILSSLNRVEYVDGCRDVSAKPLPHGRVVAASAAVGAEGSTARNSESAPARRNRSPHRSQPNWLRSMPLNTIHEVATRDRAIHTEPAIFVCHIPPIKSVCVAWLTSCHCE